MLMGEVRREQMGSIFQHLERRPGSVAGPGRGARGTLAVANRSACGKSEVGGIVDNKDFRVILERSLERSPPRLPPQGGEGTGPWWRWGMPNPPPVGAQDAEKCSHLLTPHFADVHVMSFRISAYARYQVTLNHQKKSANVSIAADRIKYHAMRRLANQLYDPPAETLPAPSPSRSEPFPLRTAPDHGLSNAGGNVDNKVFIPSSRPQVGAQGAEECLHLLARPAPKIAAPVRGGARSASAGARPPSLPPQHRFQHGPRAPHGRGQGRFHLRRETDSGGDACRLHSHHDNLLRNIDRKSTRL